MYIHFKMAFNFLVLYVFRAVKFKGITFYFTQPAVSNVIFSKICKLKLILRIRNVLLGIFLSKTFIFYIQCFLQFIVRLHIVSLQKL